MDELIEDAEVDARLRRYAGSWRDAQPAAPLALLERVVPVPAARSRHWWPVAAAAAVVIAVAVAVALVAHRSGTTAPSRPAVPADAPLRHIPGVVPYRASDYSDGYFEVSSSHFPFGNSSLRPCGPADLRLSTSDTEVSGGVVTTYYVLRSVARTVCASSGAAATLVDARGRQLPNDAPVSYGPGPYAYAVAPGEVVPGSVTWSWAAGRTAEPDRIALSLAKVTRLDDHVGSLGTVPIAAYRRAARVSGGPVSLRAAWRTNQAVPARAGSPGTLDVAIHAPRSAQLGSTVRYTVDLINRTGIAVRLRICPLVGQGVFGGQKYETGVGVHGPLACRTIPPKSIVTFAFELDTRGATPGSNLLRWSLSGPKAEFVPITLT